MITLQKDQIKCGRRGKTGVRYMLQLLTKSEKDQRLQVKRTENIVERCDKIKEDKREGKCKREENNDNVNRRKKYSHDIKVTTYSQST